MADYKQNVKSSEYDKPQPGADFDVNFRFSEKAFIALLTLFFSFMGLLVGRHNQQQKTSSPQSDSYVPASLLRDSPKPQLTSLV
ncbi:hypothetical protein SPB21_35370 [Leptothoe sp. ISB3NOV94-8A]